MSGIGLAYKTPEQQATASLDAGARAVTQPPAPQGIGMAKISPLAGPGDVDPNITPVDADPVAAAPPAPAPAAAAPVAPPAPAEDPNAPLIDFHKYPLGAIGLVLSSTAAGMEGKDSPVDKLRRDQLEAQAQQYKTAALAMDVVEKTSKFITKLKPGDRPHAIADLDKRFSGALGGHSIAPFLTAMTAGDEAETQARMDALKGMNVSPTQMAYFAADPAAAVKFIDGYLTHQASKETPAEAGAKAGAVAEAQNAAGAKKPMTPAEIAANKIAAANSGTSAASLKETQRHNTVEETNSAPGNKPLSESMVRNKMLHGQSVPQQAILNENGVWDALSAGSNAPARVVGAFGGGDALGGEKYKRGVNAVRHIIANNIYSVSGASAPESEVERQLSLALPKGTDSKKVLADKRARLDGMVESMRVGSVGGRSGGGGGSDDPLGIRGK